MKNVISRQLLSDVLEVNIKEIYKLGSNPNLDKNDLPYSIARYGDIEWINIYELAHKCKEWAFKNGMCSIDFQYDEKFYFLVVKMFSGELYQSLHISKDNNNMLIEELKAYQWIYENTKDSKNGNS